MPAVQLLEDIHSIMPEIEKEIEDLKKKILESEIKEQQLTEKKDKSSDIDLLISPYAKIKVEAYKRIGLQKQLRKLEQITEQKKRSSDIEI